MAEMKSVLIVGDDRFANQLFDTVARGFPTDAVGLTAPEDPQLPERLGQADWVIEIAGQHIERKQAVLRACAEFAPGLVSSDSSVATRHELLRDLPAAFGKRYAISHFFFPLSHCPLVEVVVGSASDQPLVAGLRDMLLDSLGGRLGRSVMELPDTPGFVANRLGLFLIASAINRSSAQAIDPNAIDRAAARSLGLPRPALFGTADLIGHPVLIDLLIGLSERLPTADALQSAAPAAIARLKDIEATGNARFIDRQLGREAETAAVDDQHVADLVVALASDRDRYVERMCSECRISPEITALAMRRSYGWTAEW